MLGAMWLAVWWATQARAVTPCTGGTFTAITDEASLRSAASFTSTDGDLTLTDDLVVTGAPIVFDDCVTLDGGGYTLDLSGMTGGGAALQFIEGGNLRNVRIIDGSQVVLDVTGDAHITSVYACSPTTQGAPLFAVSGVATMSYVVLEDLQGPAGAFAVGPSSTAEHFTVVGGGTLFAGGSGSVTSSVVDAPLGGLWTLDGATSIVPVAGDLYDQVGWDCSVDARPAPSGAAWDASGMHKGGYTGGVGEIGTTPFAGWADDDLDGHGYGPVGDPQWDCDDTNAAIAPDVDEVCNGLDEDCDLEIDEDASTTDPSAVSGYVDGDEDGVGSDEACWVCFDLSLDPACVVDDGDCDDTDPDKVDPEDCDPPDTGTPGDDDDDAPGDDDDDAPGDDDDDAPGDDDDDGLTSDTTDTTDTTDTAAALAATADDGCGCGTARIATGWKAFSRR